MDLVVITTINNNKVNDIHKNELKFDYNYNIYSVLVSRPQPLATINLMTRKKIIETHAYGLKCLW